MTFGDVVILIRSVCNNYKNNYWHKMFLEKALNNIPKNKYKCYITIELAFLKKLILIKQVHQKSVISVTIWFKFQLYRCKDAMIC